MSEPRIPITISDPTLRDGNHAVRHQLDRDQLRAYAKAADAGHNNLGMAVANSVAAADAGARIIDATARGFGAGAGNTQLEVLVPVLERSGYRTGIDLYRLLDAADLAERELISVSIVSGLAGVFSGFRRKVEAISAQNRVDPRDVFFELGRRQAVAGQEDLIVDVALELAGGATAGGAAASSKH